MKIQCNDCEKTAARKVPKGSTILGLTMHMICPPCQVVRDRIEYTDARDYKYTAVTPFGTFRADNWDELWMKLGIAAPKGRIEV